jgi:glycosyltransferase involved in cell wall biosynthesis
MKYTPPYHIAFILSGFARGGMEMRLADVVNHLDTGRWNPHIYAFYDYQAMRGAVDPGRLHTPIARRRPDPLLPWHLARLFRQEGTAIAWALSQGQAAGWGRLSAALAGVPVRILSLHDLFPVAPLTRWLSPLTDRIIMNTEQARQFAIAQGLPPHKLGVIYNGIDTARYSPGPDQRIELLGIPPDRPVILSVGRLEPEHKGQDVLLQALKILLADWPEPDNPPLLVFVGEGVVSKRGELEALTAALGLGEGVRFLGLRGDIPALMRSADVLVMASRRLAGGGGYTTESSPNVLLEAQACGLPVLATDVGGARELIREGVTGRLIPPDDPPQLAQNLAKLLADRAGRQAMAAAGPAWVAGKFSLAASIAARVALWEELLAQKNLVHPQGL